MNNKTSQVDYVCPTGRLQCSCCYDQLSNEQKAYQRGAVHAGYGWGRNYGQHSGEPYTQEQRDAYDKGYHDAKTLQA